MNVIQRSSNILQTLITIPYEELTSNKGLFLSSIDTVEFKLPHDAGAVMRYTLQCPGNSQ